MAKKSETDIELLSWIKRGKQRKDILMYIDGPETPTEISKKSGYSLNHTSRILGEFRKKGIAKCLNPKQKTGRLYELKPKAKVIRDKLKEEKKRS
ncbi:hypothetical protein GF336_04540 [Candidatus Woesearchaeota archaeon]|nr:hypothetical protein [Candidatus Woesearchaeota archaeon]